MRTIFLFCLFSVPAFGQQPMPPLDFTTGNGVAPLLWVQGMLFGPNAIQNPNWNKVNQATFYMQQADEYWGLLTYTYPGGRQSDGPPPCPTIVLRIYPISSTVTATTVTFGGFSGGPIINGTAPVAGSPYVLPPGYPPGVSAVWKSPVIERRDYVPYQLFATVGGTPSTSAGFYKPIVP